MHNSDSVADSIEPTQAEIDHLVHLYESGNIKELESAAVSLLETCPGSAFAWSVLGTAQQLQGKDALAALEKTVELAPDDAQAQLQLGNAHLASGQLDLALPRFIRALEIAPGFAAALCGLGDALQAQGHLKEAAECYRGALELEPSMLMALCGRGDILLKQQQYQAAESCYRQALAMAPAAADIHRRLGDLQVAINRPEKALEYYSKALEIDGSNAAAHAGRGNVSFRLQHYLQAAGSYGAAIQINGAVAAYHHGHARCLHAMGQLAGAETAYRRAIALDASMAGPMLHYANMLRETRRVTQAIAIYQAALLLEPENADALNNLGMALQEDGQLEQALEAFRQVQVLLPSKAISYCNMASVLNAMGQSAGALENCQHAVKAEPGFAPAHLNLGTFLMEQGRLAEAVTSLETAIQLAPRERKAYVNLGIAWDRLGRNEKAIACGQAALKIDPGWDEMHSNLLFYMTHSQQVDASRLFQEHLRFSQQFEAPFRARWPAHANSRDPGRRLRIGFVSADLYNHAVAHFITPIFEHLKDSPGLELLVYANSLHDDTISRHLHSLANTWRQVEKLTHDEFAQLVVSDAIDVLIDLSGHTGYNRLPALARKPAPVQVSWIGYPGTTGLQAVDYFLSDRYYSPPGLLDGQFTEKLVYLPACVPFLPSPEAPPLSPAPALKNKYITFGSFNRTGKLSRGVIARWAKLLRLVPDSQMLLAAMPNEKTSDMLRSWFAREGIDASRLHFQNRVGSKEYLALHKQVDVCLDTFPYTSGTTGFHALWMGVPTLTTVGSTMPGFSTAAILSHAGLDSFICQDEEQFLRKGQLLAQDFSLFADLRPGMRERMKLAANGQPALIGNGLEQALRIMWQRWCAGHPVASFAVDGLTFNGLA